MPHLSVIVPDVSSTILLFNDSISLARFSAFSRSHEFSFNSANATTIRHTPPGPENSRRCSHTRRRSPWRCRHRGAAHAFRLIDYGYLPPHNFLLTVPIRLRRAGVIAEQGHFIGRIYGRPWRVSRQGQGQLGPASCVIWQSRLQSLAMGATCRHSYFLIIARASPIAARISGSEADDICSERWLLTIDKTCSRRIARGA